MVQPIAGLNVGIYTAVVTITYDGGSTSTATVSFTVNSLPPPEILSIEINTNNSVTVSLNRPSDGKPALIIAIYDSNGKLLTMEKRDIAKSGEIIVTEITIPTTEGAKVKAMMWNSLGTMESLCSPKTKIRNGNNWVDGF